MFTESFLEYERFQVWRRLYKDFRLSCQKPAQIGKTLLSLRAVQIKLCIEIYSLNDCMTTIAYILERENQKHLYLNSGKRLISRHRFFFSFCM